MKTRYKIPLIAGIAVLIGFASIIIGPVIFMIGSNMIAGLIISSTSNETFEEDFTDVSEVKLFIERYPNYTTFHHGDFLGWKIITYTTKINDVQGIKMEVKKNVLHQGIRISASCFDSESSHALNILQDQVIDFLQNDECFEERK